MPPTTPPDTTSEVSEILTEMPRLVAQGMVYVIVAFVAVGLLWAHFSQVDVAISARGALDEQSMAEVKVLNKDMGLVEVGLPAKLKIDAYPFQTYGAVPAKVIAISPQVGGEDPNSFYRVTLEPQGKTIRVRGRSIPLRPGLALTAEIVTDHKTLLSILLEPFHK